MEETAESVAYGTVSEGNHQGFLLLEATFELL